MGRAGNSRARPFRALLAVSVRTCPMLAGGSIPDASAFEISPKLQVWFWAKMVP